MKMTRFAGLIVLLLTLFLTSASAEDVHQPSADAEQDCQEIQVASADGQGEVWVKNCGFGQTCDDDETCCRLGGSVSCCDSDTERCVKGMCEYK